MILDYQEEINITLVHFGAVRIRFFTVLWFAISTVIAILDEISRRTKSEVKMVVVSIIYFAASLLCTFSAVSILPFYEAHSFHSPSLLTIFGFVVFWSLKMLETIHYDRRTKYAYLILPIVGVVSLIGHVFDIPVLYLSSHFSSGMSAAAGVGFILLGISSFLLDLRK
jgi:hypothetical protein